MLRRSLYLSRFIRWQSNSAEIPSGVPPFAQRSPLTKENASEKPLPINVEAVYHAPLKIPIQYGDLVADLQLRSYDHESLDFFADFIMRTGFYLGMPLTGPKPFPTRRERWTVIRSPFVHAKSKENFERHTHKRLIRVWDSNPEVVQMWLSYITKHSVAGVGAKCNVYQRAGLSLDMDNAASELQQSPVGESHNMDEAVGEKVLELLNSDEFKKHL
ncbi:hypothetical protein ZYGR_0P02750 [Zygosaccharomyces rouxii]|uniref:Small ribosomal subunit protein uS10m n=2 Tax=Zygosaccharomyces rouxii TaxID=4956 RepID=C5E4L0_ZYGRC|nr:mitochondrial 37S ribosomal protein RSM10 [Zygosaccharomyces rouxii]KAH9198173.1 mitochondrial 37S ribosomal protein RSM10 [Zygosaccharomyces rouxii]GAV49630.1 hypothetical protein ZYGR_0P02750 [Zygosaccharomyces rouxii]CAR30971.1 ZYRO0E06974p [Zygosaccharomyces rouxii]